MKLKWSFAVGCREGCGPCCTTPWSAPHPPHWRLYCEGRASFKLLFLFNVFVFYKQMRCEQLRLIPSLGLESPAVSFCSARCCLPNIFVIGWSKLALTRMMRFFFFFTHLSSTCTCTGTCVLYHIKGSMVGLQGSGCSARPSSQRFIECWAAFARVREKSTGLMRKAEEKFQPTDPPLYQLLFSQTQAWT